LRGGLDKETAVKGTEEQNAVVEEARALGDSVEHDSFDLSNFLCEHLDDPPEHGIVVFKAVLADNFHQEKRSPRSRSQFQYGPS
jgi:hypothetical protein